MTGPLLTVPEVNPKLRKYTEDYVVSLSIENARRMIRGVRIDLLHQGNLYDVYNLVYRDVSVSKEGGDFK